MRSRVTRIGFVMLAMVCRTAPALAQYDLQGGIQDLVKQMVASMEQQQKRKLAILDFTKLDGSVDNFGRYLAEGLITTMFRTGKFEVIERKQLDKILAELKLNLSDLIDPQNAQRLGRGYGVGAIAVGSVTELADAVEVNARLIETETGKVFSAAKTRFARDKDVLALIGGSPGPGPPPEPPGTVASSARMVLISAGPFTYGPEGQEQKLSLPAFSIDLYEVTNAEYAKVRPHEYPPDKANQPVVNVSWFDAKRYCEAVGKRLPTAQEWEKAARGTDGRYYPWGDTYDPKKVNGDGRFGGTTPVGQFPTGRSPYGVMDMAGNVSEWIQPARDGNATYCGGSWKDGSFALRARCSSGTSAYYQLNWIGFRCARSS